jgi:two-component system, LuxR family, sensor kinase FixL
MEANAMDCQLPQVLLIEDEEDHVELIRRALSAGVPPLELTAVHTLQEARVCLSNGAPDLVITDLRLPDGNGMEILPARPEEARFPVVVLTGCGNESAAVSALKQGALDYVVKSETTLAEIGRIAHRALREWHLITDHRRAEERLRESEARYRSLFEDSPLPLREQDFSAVKRRLDTLHKSGVKDFRRYFRQHPETVRECLSLVKILDMNQAALTLYRAESKEQFWTSLPILFGEDSGMAFSEGLALIAEGQWTFSIDNTMQTVDGKIIHVVIHFRAAPGCEENLKKVFVAAVDITARKQAEKALHQANAELEERVSQRTSELATANKLLQHEIEERYAVEEMLRQQEMDLSFALEAAGAVAFTWNVHEDWIRRLDGGCSDAKLSPVQTLDQAAARVHPEDRWNWETKIQAALQGSGRYESEHRLIQPDGTLGWVLEKGKVTYDPVGKPVQLFGVTVDIRKQILARQRIEELAADAKIELAKLHAVIQSMREALFIIDAQGNLVLANPAAMQLIGDAGFEQISADPQQIIDALELRDQEGRILRFPDWPMQRILRGDNLFNLEFTVRSKTTGKQGIISCNGAPVRDDQGAVVLGVLTVRDITDQKQAADKLAHERDNMLNVLEAMHDGVYISDLEGNLQYVNSELRKDFGDPAGRKCYEYFHNRLDMCRPCRSGDILPNKISRNEFSNPKSGRMFDVIDSPLQNPDGSVSKLSIFHDITDRKEAETRLKRLQDELAHAARVKTMGEMASGLAHELNQPLAAILLKAEVGAEKVQHEKAPRKKHVLEVLRFVADQAHRSGEIIRRMKHFVQKNEPKQAPLDLTDAVQEVTALLKNDLDHASIRIEVRLEPLLPRVYADRIQFQQVLMNLVRNAVEAMEETESECRLLAVEARRQGRMAEITISDSGPGVAEEGLEKLFDTFYSTKSGGMGLGLAICRSIIEAHGGRIRAAPHAPRGTSFIFTLPLFDKDAVHESPTYCVHCG